MSPLWAWRRSSFSRCSASSRRSGRTPRSCLSSKMRAWDFRSPITGSCWKPAGSCWAASPTNCGATKPSPPPISAVTPRSAPNPASYQSMVTIQVPNLINFVAEVFSHSESSTEEARRIATYLTTANLTGHDSHGVIRVPVYVRWKKMGSVVPNQTAEVVVDTPSLAVVDGKFGYGQTVTPQAVRIGIDKCKKAGLAAVALRNAGHIGRVGDWAEMAAAEGLVSVHFVNAAGSLLVAPYGGVEKRLST